MTSRLGASRSGPSPAPLGGREATSNGQLWGNGQELLSSPPSPLVPSHPHPQRAWALSALSSALSPTEKTVPCAGQWPVPSATRGVQLPGSGFQPQPWLSPTKPVSVLVFPQKQGWHDGAHWSSSFSNPQCVLNLTGSKQVSVLIYADCQDWMTAHQGKCLGPFRGTPGADLCWAVRRAHNLSLDLISDGEEERTFRY